MGLLNRLFGRKPTASSHEAEAREPVCLHTSAVAQWDAPEDMGKEDRASRWVCAACGETFTPIEFEALRSSEAERVRNLITATPEGEAKD